MNNSQYRVAIPEQTNANESRSTIGYLLKIEDCVENVTAYFSMVGAKTTSIHLPLLHYTVCTVLRVTVQRVSFSSFQRTPISSISLLPFTCNEVSVSYAAVNKFGASNYSQTTDILVAGNQTTLIYYLHYLFFQLFYHCSLSSYRTAPASYYPGSIN